MNRWRKFFYVLWVVLLFVYVTTKAAAILKVAFHILF